MNSQQTTSQISFQTSNRRSRRFWLLSGSLLLVLTCAGVLYLIRPFFFLSGGSPFFDTTPIAQQVILSDFNGDGTLDAYIAIGHGSAPYPDRILYNDGGGNFTPNSDPLSSWISFSAAAGDLTGNGLADVLIDITGGGLTLFINQDGRLQAFSPGGQQWGFLAPGPKGVMGFRPVFGDLTGDGHLDIFAAGCCGRPANLRPEGSDPLLSYSQVWLNNGSGGFTATGQIIGQMGSNDVALADLNGDGRLDVFLANGLTLYASGVSGKNTPNTVWFNDGAGQFSDSLQRLGEVESQAAAAGDLNGDGFPDIVVGNRGPDEVWLNDGTGFLTDSGQRLGSSLTRYIFLVDLNGSGYLDIFASGQSEATIWFNDGTGQFTLSNQKIRYDSRKTATLGDIRGIGLIDILVAGADSYQVWTNDGVGLFTAGKVFNFEFHPHPVHPGRP
jgi:hypothetical protein